MTTTVGQLAELVRGTVHGDGAVLVQAARPLQQAKPGDITLVENARYLPHLQQSRASAAVVPANACETTDRSLPQTVLIQVADPLMAFVAIVQHFQAARPRSEPPPGIHPQAAIHPRATIGADAAIHPFVMVGENTVIGKRCRLYAGVVIGSHCRLGDDVVLHPHVVLYDDTVLGDRVIVHANAVLGADGFGYRFAQGRHVKVPQLGNVMIGSDVEIGACTTIDRGTFGATTVGDGSKIDNLVQIAHNCRIGQHNILASQVGIAGSCATGNYVVMAGQVGVRDHVNVGEAAQLGAKSGVIHDIPPHGRVFGYPAQEEREIARMLAVMKKLPQMRKNLLRVLKHLGMGNEAEQSESLS